MKVKKIAALMLAAAMAVSALTGCSSLDKEATVATLGGENISLGLVNFMIRFQQSVLDDVYVSYMGDGYWNQEDQYTAEEGDTILDGWKTSCMEEVHEYYTLKQHMADYSVELSDDDMNTIKESAKQFMDDNSQEALDEMGATTEIVEEYLELVLIRNRMNTAIIADADVNVSNEEANMRGYTMLSIRTDQYYDSNTGVYVSYSKEEVAELESKAELIATSLELGGEIETVASEQGFTTSKGAYSKNDEELDEAILTALDELEVGETSGMIKTDNGMYFARIDNNTDDEATNENRLNIIMARQEELYESVLEGWQEEDGWKVYEDQLEKIQFRNGFTTVNPNAVEETTEVTTESAETEAAEDAETETTGNVEDTETDDAESEDEAEDEDDAE